MCVCVPVNPQRYFNFFRILNKHAAAVSERHSQPVGLGGWWWRVCVCSCYVCVRGECVPVVCIRVCGLCVCLCEWGAVCVGVRGVCVWSVCVHVVCVCTWCVCAIGAGELYICAYVYEWSVVYVECVVCVCVECVCVECVCGVCVVCVCGVCVWGGVVAMAPGE